MSDAAAFAPFSLDEDIANLRALLTDFRKCIDGDITVDALRENLQRLPGHMELKESISELFLPHDGFVLPTAAVCRLSMGQLRREIAELMSQNNPDQPSESDSDPEWSALYEDIDEEDLAEMTTDEDEEEVRPPVARRLEFLKLRL